MCKEVEGLLKETWLVGHAPTTMLGPQGLSTGASESSKGCCGSRGSSQENPLITLETLVTNPPLTVLHTAARGVETARHCVRAEAGMGSPEMNSEWSDTCYPVSLWGCWRLCGSPERGKSVDLGSQGRCLWEEALSCPPPSLPYPPTTPSPSSPPPPGPPATTKAAAFPPQLHSW